MKTIKLFIALVMVISFAQISQAQDRSIGLYLTLNDYTNHKLSFDSGTNKIKLNGLLETNNVVVWHEGKQQVFSKKEIFGYRYKNEDYRFFNNEGYKIIDTKDFYIYSRPKLSQQGKGLKPVEAYYFSNATDGIIEPLTINNLEVAYAREPKFKYAVEQQFKSDNELVAYDEAIKEYKLKYLFDQTIR